jgi:hypothetical protein
LKVSEISDELPKWGAEASCEMYVVGADSASPALMCGNCGETHPLSPVPERCRRCGAVVESVVDEGDGEEENDEDK